MSDLASGRFTTERLDGPTPAAPDSGDGAVASRQPLLTNAGKRRSIVARLRVLRPNEPGPLPVLVGLAAVWVFFQAEDSVFLSSRNLSNLILQMAVPAVLAMAVVLVLIAGDIDLSLGSVTGVTSALLAVLVTNDHWGAGLFHLFHHARGF